MPLPPSRRSRSCWACTSLALRPTPGSHGSREPLGLARRRPQPAWRSSASARCCASSRPTGSRPSADSPSSAWKPSEPASAAPGARATTTRSWTSPERSPTRSCGRTSSSSCGTTRRRRGRRRRSDGPAVLLPFNLTNPRQLAPSVNSSHLSGQPLRFPHSAGPLNFESTIQPLPCRTWRPSQMTPPHQDFSSFGRNIGQIPVHINYDIIHLFSEGL